MPISGFRDGFALGFFHPPPLSGKYFTKKTLTGDFGWAHLAGANPPPKSCLKLQVEDPLEIWLAVAPVEGREVGSGYIP